MKAIRLLLLASPAFFLLSCNGDKENTPPPKPKTKPVAEWNKSFALNNAVPTKDTLLVKYTPKFVHHTPGYPVVTYNYDSSGRVLSHTTDVFDKKGNLVENNTISKDSSQSAITAYKYDKNGNVVESIVTKKGKVTRSVYKYDDKDNQVEEDVYTDSLLTTKTFNTFNDKGKNVKSVTTNGFGKLRVAANRKYSDNGTLYQYTIISRGKGIITKDIYSDTDPNDVGRWQKQTETWHDTANAFTMKTLE